MMKDKLAFEKHERVVTAVFWSIVSAVVLFLISCLIFGVWALWAITQMAVVG